MTQNNRKTYMLKDIYKVIKILDDLDDIYWKEKLLVLTWNFKYEFEKLKKPLEFILEMLQKGDHILISKKLNKYNVVYPFRKKLLCLSYVEQEDIILILIKPKRRK